MQNESNMKPKASVIIATYNRKELLRYCLERLLNQTTPDYEIIVVDDGSTDNTSELNEIKRVRYFRNANQMGQPFSRNKGIREANGEIIIFVDSDVMVGRKFIEDHISLHKIGERLIVQGLVRHIKHPKDAGAFSLRIDGFSRVGLVTQNVSIEKTMERFKTSFQKKYQWSKNIVYLGNKYNKRFIPSKRVLTISRFLQLSRWAEKDRAVKFLVSNMDFPIFFITPMLKEIMKYHYRAKGMLEAIELLNEKSKT
ncbi:MAG: glycosyltransferase family 2 protein [Candidatus Stahlbacteria bacterium]|nr:glycosyltransferase family 2 protein [Candidatus Stahlbacteria bacterium]